MRYAVVSVIMMVVGVLGIGWVIEGNDFALAKVFAPRREALRRQTFEESKAYNDGMAQELASAQFDYDTAETAEQKRAIGALVAHRMAGYDTSKLPPDLRTFVETVRRGAP